LGLFQHNWVVLAYNFNVLIWVPIIGEVMYRCISSYPFITILSLLLPCIIILFLHLLSTNHKCTHLCYFPLLLKPVAQKERTIMVATISVLIFAIFPFYSNLLLLVEEFLATCCPSCHSCGVMEPSVVP
jgi:hypothetical protein